MNLYTFIPIFFVFACVAAAGSKAYVAVGLGILGAALCVSDLKPLGQAIAGHRGRTVSLLAALMVLALALNL